MTPVAVDVAVVSEYHVAAQVVTVPPEQLRWIPTPVPVAVDWSTIHTFTRYVPGVRLEDRSVIAAGVVEVVDCVTATVFTMSIVRMSETFADLLAPPCTTGTSSVPSRLVTAVSALILVSAMPRLRSR